MKKLLILPCLLATTCLAQTAPLSDYPRTEDHMYSRRVLVRIDLQQKLNNPFVHLEAQDDRWPMGTETPSLTYALLHAALEQPGTLALYKPDQLEQPLSPTELATTLKKRNITNYPVNPEELPENPEAPKTDPDSWTLEDPFLEEDPMVDAPDLSTFNVEMPAENPTDVASSDPFAGPLKSDDYFGTNLLVEIVEDRIFDKNKGTWIHQPRYIRLLSVRSDNVGTEQYPLCAIRWEDAEPLLKQLTWKNPHNEAEQRSAHAMLTDHMYTETLLNISGEAPATLALADKRRQQLVTYEHNLWNY